VERRIIAIFIARSEISSSGTISTPYTAVRAFTSRRRSFRTAIPVVQQLNAAVLFAATFLIAAARRLAFGLHRGPLWAGGCRWTLSVVCMCFGSLIILEPDLCLDRHRRAGHSRAGAIIEASALAANRRQRHLPHEVADPRHRGFYSSFNTSP